MTSRPMLGAFVLAVLCGASAPPAHAGVVHYEAVDLIEINPGADLWQYRYVLSGFGFDVGQGFAVYFTPDRYADLWTPAPPPADWDELVVQPDPVLASDGFLDELAVVNEASLANAFVVNFTWLGGGQRRPGSQLYELYVQDAQGMFTVIGEGLTQPLNDVPEPSGGLLVAAVAMALALRRRLFAPRRDPRLAP